MNALFSPFKIKNVTLKNRFVMCPMQRGKGWTENFTPTARLRDYYRAAANGGVGLVISEGTMIDHPAASAHDFLMLLNEDTASAWKECIDAVHEEGSKMFIQLFHEGSVRKENLGGPAPEHPTLGPSGLIRADHKNGREASLEELENIRDSYVRAATLAQEIGADGVEVHCAHGYLLDQFFWHETNIRTDQYGGLTLAERARFPAEVFRGIRRAVGDDYVISCRFSQWKEADYQAKIAPSPHDLEEFVKILRTAGADIFHVSTRRFYEPEWPDSDLGIAGWVKKMTDAAVITVGSVGLDVDIMDTFYTDKELHSNAEQSMDMLLDRFNNGEFDLVALGRSILGDPQWVNKVAQQRYSEIIPFHRKVLAALTDNWDDSLLRETHK